MTDTTKAQIEDFIASFLGESIEQSEQDDEELTQVFYRDTMEDISLLTQEELTRLYWNDSMGAFDIHRPL